MREAYFARFGVFSSADNADGTGGMVYVSERPAFHERMFFREESCDGINLRHFDNLVKTHLGKNAFECPCKERFS